MPETTQRREWYQIRNAAKDDSGPAEILIYDEIDSWFGVAAEDLARAITALDDDRELTVRINSPGGNVFDGVAILNSLRGHPGHVTTIVDGLAASAASYIAQGGDTIIMRPNSEMMIHDASGIVLGGSADMRKMADRLDQATRNIASIYADRTGGTVDEWLDLMGEETWFSAQEAVDAGLADRIEKPSKNGDDADRKMVARFDLSMFNHAGRRSAPAPRIPLAHNQAPQPNEAEGTNKEDGHMATLKEGLAEKLGIAPDADDETMLAAIDEALTERADEQPETPAEPAPPVEPTVEQATQVAAKFGLTLVDKASHDKLVADVHLLNQERAQQERTDDESIVDNAIKDGRIAVASRDSFLNYMRADRQGARNALLSISPNTIPVASMGHGYSNENTNVDPELETMFNRVAGISGKDA